MSRFNPSLSELLQMGVRGFHVAENLQTYVEIPDNFDDDAAEAARLDTPGCGLVSKYVEQNIVNQALEWAEHFDRNAEAPPQIGTVTTHDAADVDRLEVNTNGECEGFAPEPGTTGVRPAADIPEAMLYEYRRDSTTNTGEPLRDPDGQIIHELYPFACFAECNDPADAAQLVLNRTTDRAGFTYLIRTGTTITVFKMSGTMPNWRASSRGPWTPLVASD